MKGHEGMKSFTGLSNIFITAAVNDTEQESFMLEGLLCFGAGIWWIF